MSDTPSSTLGPSRSRGDETARKWRKRRSRLRRRLRRAGDGALVALAVFAVGFGLQRARGGGSNGSTTTATAAPGSIDARFPPMHDVRITSCRYWKTLYAGGVNMVVENPTNTSWTYYVDVRFQDGNQKYAETVLHSKPVAPAHHGAVDGWGFAPSRTPPKQLTCTIVSVKRVGT